MSSNDVDDGAVVHSYPTNDTGITNLTEYLADWPPGSFLMHILQSEGQLEALMAQDASCSNPLHWQLSARRALLEKYGYLLPSQQAVHSSSMRRSSTTANDAPPPQLHDDADKVQSCWAKVIQDCIDRHSRPRAEGEAAVAAAHNDEREEENDLIDFLSSQCRTSNGRRMQWCFMTCPAGLQFPLHAHPNLELVYCCSTGSALHEIRMDGPPIRSSNEESVNTSYAATEATNPKVVGPALTTLRRSWTFGTLQAGQWLVNEVGSIHKSFTATNAHAPCRLLVLWGGSHADIKQPPTSVNVTQAVTTMDRRLCDCQHGDAAVTATAIVETFLPESEKRQRISTATNR